MVSIVVCSLLLLDMLLLVLMLTLVLLYHCTHYTVRGGCSDRGVICGVFFIAATAGADSAGWYYGAALSFKIKIYL